MTVHARRRDRAGKGSTPAARFYRLGGIAGSEATTRLPKDRPPFRSAPVISDVPRRLNSRRAYLRFGRPAFFPGGGGASTFRPKPEALANADLAARNSAATIG
jgi:hypothetical protein